MEEFQADLHCHSTCSDGTLTPKEIVELAQINNLSGLSITDHDSIQAYHTAVPEANERNIKIISGVEFSAMHRGHSVHLLAYSFSLNSPIIQEFCDKHAHRRTERNRQILTLLAKNGMNISEAEIQVPDITMKHTIGRPHIASAMLKKGYITSFQEAFNLYIGEGKPCYAPGGYFTVEETIDLIHNAKGFAIIAHPHLIDKNDLLQDLIKMPFDGIEGYYARFNNDQCQRWIKIGMKKNWIITGGSDFHGSIKPTLALGSSWTNQETFQMLYQRFIENQTV